MAALDLDVRLGQAIYWGVSWTSWAQKGFMEHEDCYDDNLLMGPFDSVSVMVQLNH